MAQVIERGARIYLVRVFLGRDEGTGKRRHHNKTIHGTKKDAEKYARKIQHQVDTGTFHEAAHQSVAEYLNEWLETKARRTVRRRTWEGYRSVLRLHVLPVIGEIPLGKLTPSHVERIVRIMVDAEKSPQTVRNALTPLRHALNGAVKHGVIPANPAAAELLDLPRQTKRQLTILDREEAQAFVEAAKEQGVAGSLFIVLLGSGMRPGEALGLKWSDYDGRRVQINRALVRPRGGAEWNLRDPKTKKSRRTVPLPGFAREAMKEQRRRQAEEQLRAGPDWKDHGLIFTGELGNPLRWRTLAAREFQWILIEADLPKIRPYDLRHTCASLLLRAEVNPKVVSERLGHSTVALTLDTYSSVLPGLQEEATERLGEMIQ